MLARVDVKPVDPNEQKRIADAVMADLGKWGPGEWPMRPKVLTWDDGQIVDAYRSRENGNKMKADELAQLSFFGTWRGAIFKMESDNAGKLQVLLRVACYLEWTERWEDLEQLQQFIRDWYHLPLPRTDIPQNPTWHAKTCERYTQNRTLLPSWLREMTRPPPGYETRESGAKKEGKPVPAAQTKLGFVGEDD